ncbi:exopolyphosphatase [Orbaceae bacterium ac157xtp]
MLINNEQFDEYAVVDLGSNSFHMIIVRKNGNALQTIYKNKQNVHLATGLDKNFNLSDSSIKRGVACLKLFSERLQDFPTSHVRVIATHALRVAKNRYQFLAEAAKVFPFPIQIISGQEEARLIYIGAINNEDTKQSKVKFVIDIGGGSTEIAIGTESSPILAESRPMGCVTYTKQFFSNKKVSKTNFKKACYAAEQQIEKIISLVKTQNISVAYGTSGTIKAIHNILLDLGVTDGIITPQRLNDLVTYILEFKDLDSINYPSLSKDRKNVFLAGLAIFCGVFSAFDIKELYYCQSALREGILYEMTGNYGYQDICKNTVISLSKQYHIDEKHATQVVKTAQHLIKQWKTQSSLLIEDSLETMLYWAAMLHEIGLSINFSNIHKHSGYIIKNCNMPGFNEEQQNLLSTLIRYHRKSIKFDNFPYFSLFESKQIYPLLQILRLAILINNQRSIIQDLDVIKLKLIDNNPQKFELIINNTFAHKNRLILLDLEQEQFYWLSNKDWELKITIN